MSIWEHSRWKIYNPSQHPYVHVIDDFGYTNGRMPGISRLGDAINYIVAVLYPNFIGNYATKLDLPLTASANDYATVSDDGDGKSAGYVWAVLDGTAGWVKRYDMDWSTESILAQTVDRTQALYVHKNGVNDRDANGAEVTGTFAGQTVYGGSSANTNLTLAANSGDTVGVHTGYVQTDDDLRPASDGVYTLGTPTNRWADLQAIQAKVADIEIDTGSIVSDSGQIEFGANDLTTTGVVSADQANVTTQAVVSDLTLSEGSIVASGGEISFGSTDLSTTGTLASGVITASGDLVLGAGSIESASGEISFNGNDLTSIGEIDASVVDAGSALIGDLDISGSQIAVATGAASDDLSLLALGPAGKIQLLSDVSGGNLVLSGDVEATTAGIGSLELSTDTISNPTGAIVLSPDTSVYTQGDFSPSTDAAISLGESGGRFSKLWLSGSIGGSTEITVSDLLTLRAAPYRDAARTVPAQDGDALFWSQTDGAWLADHPDSEILHSEVAGITTGDAGHTQFVMLTGRAGGQTVSGGTVAGQNLTLRGSSAGGGSVVTQDSIKPSSDASYSGMTLNGVSLGDSVTRLANVYTRGEFVGMRVQNVTSGSRPSLEAVDTGRVVFETNTKKLTVNTGTEWKVLSVLKVEKDETFDGVSTSKAVDVSAVVTDARTCLWQLYDVSSGNEQIYATLKTAVGTVTVETGTPLPAGTYKLVGIE